MTEQVTAVAPASVSNVSCGFDIMGFALESPVDRVTVRRSPAPGVHIRPVDGSESGIPRDPALNTAGPPLAALLREAGGEQGVEIEIAKGIPVGGGIGSSAASAVAAAVAANELLGTGLPHQRLMELAAEGEKIASGSVHVDNVAPALWGGFLLVRGYSPIDIVRVRVPGDLWCAVVSPRMAISTSEARKLIPRAIPIADVVAQTGNAAGLIAGLLTGDYELIGRSLRDLVAEPVRKHLIPAFDRMRDAAIGAGALGFGISGSGPSCFALARTRETALVVASVLRSALLSEGQEAAASVSRVGAEGARIVRE